jgi:hypothetical protein
MENNSVNIKDIINDLYINLKIIEDQTLINKISKSSDIFPMYDIYTKNIILVDHNEIFDKLTKYHYRPLDNYIVSIINESGDKKLINFIKNFNLEILNDTFYKIIYNNNPNTEEITTCIRPSFLPIFRYLTPYYTKTELIYMALNNNIWDDNYDLKSVCDKVTQNDVKSDKLLEHQIFIKENAADNYVKYYSFLGSSPFNNYLRFPENNNKNLVLENHINNFRSLLIKSPEWDQSYYFYRWISNDEFLKKYKVGDIWLDYGFLSTTRQPFVDPDKNYFGYILVKIIVPKNIQGCGLAIEYYSHFPEEQEIVFPPSKYKLINNDKIKYFHPNEKLIDKIKTKYEFEWIGHIDDYIRYNLLKELPIINTLDDYIEGINTYEKLDNFYKRYPHRFYANIGNQNILFNVAKIESGPYDQFFYMNKIEYNERKFTLGKDLFITWEDEVTGKINLLIEIGTVISVNYYFKFNPNAVKITDNYKYDDIMNFINKIAFIFNISKIIIHPSYSKYWNVINHIDNSSYDDIKLYNSDCFYFNETLYKYVFESYMIKHTVSDYTKSIIEDKNCKLTCSYETLNFLLSMDLNEFVNIIQSKNIIYDPYIELIIKIANKIISSKINTINKLDLIKKAKRKLVPGYKLIDLYVFLFINYYYLITYLHGIILDKFNINLDEIYYILNNDKNSVFSIIDFDKISEQNISKINKIYVQKRQYTIKHE